MAFQAKLLKFIKLNFGKKYKLPSCLIINYPEGLFSKEYFRDFFLKDTCEINDGEQYLLIDIVSQEGLEMELRNQQGKRTITLKRRADLIRY